MKYTLFAWMHEPINFGGELLTYTQVQQWFADNNCPTVAFDRWMQGYELSQRIKKVS